MNKKNSKSDFLDVEIPTKEQLGNFARLSRLTLENVNKRNYYRKWCAFWRKYDKDDVMRWIAHPEANYRQLRDVSLLLYEISPQYKRLINYFSKMMLFSYTVTPFKLDRSKPIDKELLKESYYSVLNLLEKMKLRHELTRVFLTCFKEDIFYGYIYRTTDSFYIKKLHPDFCKISQIEDGCFLYAFDFMYFDTRKDELDYYGDEFKRRYELYKKNGNSSRWQILKPERQFCIKFNEDIPYPSIPFVGVFEGIFDIQDYKGLKKVKAENDNYKVLALEIPINTEGDYLISYDDIVDYYERLVDVLPENIGAFITPTKVEDFSFENTGTNDINNVNDATKTFWNDAGVSSVIFGLDKPTAASLNAAIKADESMVFALARQCERNINRLFKHWLKHRVFQIQILDITVFNQSEMFNMYLKAAQASCPTVTMTCAAMGMTPTQMIDLCYLETEVLDLPNKFKPLSTSYTMSGDDEGGAPTQEEKGEELSDSGEQTRESEAHVEYE